MTDINEYITNDYRPFSSEMPLAEVKDFFAGELYTHFPVIENGVYIGCIGVEDADTFDDDKTLSDYRYSMDGFFVRKEMLWLDVLEVFARNNTNVLPVLDEANKYVGYYEISDIIKLFNETPFIREHGGIVVVEKGLLDYSIGEIVQIVESNNGKVLGLFVSQTTTDSVQVTVKMAMGSMNETIQTFRRYNYEIVSEHQEDTYLNNLKDRSDYLDKYLNI